MISGHLAEKKGFLYMVINITGPDGKKKPKWIATHLKVKGNKKRAEEMLQELRRQYTVQEAMQDRSRAVFFDAYLLEWLESRRNKIAISTFSGYQSIVCRKIAPYFREKNILLNSLRPVDIQEYYQTLADGGLSGNTIMHHHVIIRKVLDDAVLRELIPFNPADRIERPQKELYVADCYTPEECCKLLNCLAGEKLELAILLTLFYGLRRSEVLGLKWGAIDFINGRLSITHTVTTAQVDNHYQTVCRNQVKRKSSYRTLPLVGPISSRLKQEANKRYGNTEPPRDDYICVDEKGRVFKPNYLSQGFERLLKRYGLRKIRFHDLRHSCANMLIASRVPLIEVQQWLGHSSILTTADMYAHLSFDTKLNSAETIKNFNDESNE